MTIKHLPIFTFLLFITSSLWSQQNIDSIQKKLDLVPLGIQKNWGQINNDSILYFTDFAGHKIRFCQNKISFDKTREHEDEYEEHEEKPPLSPLIGPEFPGDQPKGKDEVYEHLVWNLDFVGINPKCKIEPKGFGPTTFHYHYSEFQKSDVPSYAELWYRNIYPGVDARFYGMSNQRLKYDFILQKSSNIHQIILRYDGVQSMYLDTEGNLHLNTLWGELIEEAPVSHIQRDGVVIPVKVRYTLLGETTFGFACDDPAVKPDDSLVIDPIFLNWGTFVGSLGGSNKNYAFAMDLNTDLQIYVTGLVESGTMPVTSGAWQTARNSGPGGLYYNYANLGNSIFYNDAECDAMAYKLSKNADTLIWCSYLGGTNFDVGTGIEVSSDSNIIYITGITQSSNFPTTTAGTNQAIATSYDNSIGGAGVPDAFVAVFNAAGSKLRWSTYLGGNGHDEGYDIALDDSNNIYLTGGTASPNFPVSPSGNTNGDRGRMDVYVTKFNKLGALQYSKVIGGSGTGSSNTANTNNRYECGFGIAVKPNHSAIVCGTARAGFPFMDSSIFTGGNYSRLAQQGFVLGVAPSGTGSLLFNSRISGYNANDTRVDYTLEATQSMFPGTYCYDLILDDSNNIYLTGATSSDSLKVSPWAYQTSRAGGFDGFLVKLDSQASSLKYSTYIGGSEQDFMFGIDLDCQHNPFITGKTAGNTSNNFPTTSNAFQTTYGGSYGDLIYSGFTNLGSKLAISSFMGGDDYDYGFGQIKSDGTNTYIAGTTHSGGAGASAFPSTSGTFQSSHPNDGLDASFVIKLTFAVTATPSDSIFCASASGLTNVTLVGTDPSPYLSFWAQTEGPVTATILNPSNYVATATKMTPGFYRFVYYAYDPCRGDTSKDTASFYIQNCDNDIDGLTNLNDIDDDDDGIPDVVEVCGSGATSFSCMPSSQDPSGDADGDGYFNYTDANWCTLNSKGVCASLDHDSDGIINQFDRDSDNDGIPDIIEAGGTDTNGDGKIDSNLVARNDADGDGLFDKYDTNCDGVNKSGWATTVSATSGTITNSANAVDNDSTTYAILNSNGAYIDVSFPIPVERGKTITIRMRRNGTSNGTVSIQQYDSLTGTVGNATNYTSTNTETSFNYIPNITTRRIRITRTNSNATRVYIAKYNYLPCAGQLGTSLSTPWNADGDTKPNYLDLDSDNDGIPDLVEVGGADDNNDGLVDDYNPSSKTFLRQDLDFDGFTAIYDADTNNANLLTFNNAQVISSGLVSSGPLVITGADTDNDGEPNSYVTGDPDKDTVLNCYDLDSDNDGIVDIIEVGGSDSNRDGKVDSYTDSDGDGWNNSQDGFGTGSGNSPLISPATDADNNGYAEGTNRWSSDNADLDNFANFIDTDADGDGITDNTEAQATASYIAPGTADANRDGLLDAYGTISGTMGLVPVNTDSSDEKDYLDADADNDGWADTIEGHDTNGDNTADSGSPSNNGVPSGTDADYDGLDDGYDNNSSSFNPTNGSLQPTSHPNMDLSSTTQRDWREPVFAISGTIYNDFNGLRDNQVNGIGMDNPSSFTMYVYLVDSASGKVIRKDTLNSGNGTFLFTNLNKDTAYYVRLSTQNVGLYAVAPSTSTLPSNWVHVGENYGSNNQSGNGNESGTANGDIKVKIGTADVTAIAIGIDARPVGTDKSATSILNPGGSSTVQTPSLIASDAEQTTIGTGGKFVINTLPVNGTLRYNGVALSVGDTITNYDSTLLRVDPTFNGSGSISFTYTAIDSANVGDSIPNTISMSFLGLTISGTLYHDPDGLTDGNIDGTAIDAPSGTQAYVYLVDSTNSIVGKDTLNSGNGSYSFTNQANAYNSYTVIFSTSNHNLGDAAPGASTWPSNWVSIGEQYGTNNSSGTGIESGTPNSIISVQTGASSVTMVNAGIEQKPEAQNKSYSSIDPRNFPANSGNGYYPYRITLNNTTGGASSNGDVTLSDGTLPGRVSGSDPEDGNYAGSSGNATKTFVLISLPDSQYNILAYHGIALKPGPAPSDSSYQYWNATFSRYEIPNFDPDSLELFMKPANLNSTSTSFSYSWKDTANILGTTGNYSIGALMALNLQITSFHAHGTQNEVKVKWSVVNEKEVAYYRILKSNQPAKNEWTELAQKQPLLHLGNEAQYEVLDPNPGNDNYYQLEVINTNGKRQLTNPVRVTFGPPFELELLPNPATSHDVLTLVSGEYLTGETLSIIDASGKMVHQQTLYGDHKIYIINSNKLAQGVYIIHITYKGESHQIKVIIH